jgi:hypothetical protein
MAARRCSIVLELALEPRFSRMLDLAVELLGSTCGGRGAGVDALVEEASDGEALAEGVVEHDASALVRRGSA